MIAEITKVASAFKAARVRVGLAITIRKAEELANILEEMGLQSNIFNDKDGRIWFNLIVPLEYDPMPPHIPTALCNVILDFDKSALGLGEAKEVELICPVSSPCKWGEYYGTCAVCGGDRPIIGPIVGDIPFIMANHALGSQICEGSGRMPKKYPLPAPISVP